jgi:hypothetical protein
VGGVSVVPLPQSVYASGAGYLDKKTDLLYFLGQGGYSRNITVFNCTSKTIIQRTSFTGPVFSGLFYDSEIGLFTFLINQIDNKLQLAKLDLTTGKTHPLTKAVFPDFGSGTFDPETGDLYYVEGFEHPALQVLNVRTLTLTDRLPLDSNFSFTNMEGKFK